jgi:hypothetical protein
VSLALLFVSLALIAKSRKRGSHYLSEENCVNPLCCGSENVQMTHLDTFIIYCALMERLWFEARQTWVQVWVTIVNLPETYSPESLLPGFLRQLASSRRNSLCACNCSSQILHQHSNRGAAELIQKYCYNWNIHVCFLIFCIISMAFIFMFFFKEAFFSFLLGYVHCMGGIHCDKYE